MTVKDGRRMWIKDKFPVLWDFFHKRKQKVLASLTSKLFEECQPYGILFWIDCAHTPATCTIHLKNIFSLSPFPFTIIMLFYSSQAYSAQTIPIGIKGIKFM